MRPPRCKIADMNTELPTDSKTHADPADLHRQLEEVETRLETALSDEHATEAELRDLEVSADRDAADAYLSGKVAKADAKVDGLRTRLRAIRSAKISLMAKRDLLESEGQTAQLDSLIAEASRLNEERQRDYEVALALQAITARLFARSLGNLTGGYELPGRICRNGIIAPSDSEPGAYLSELARISTELRSLGYADAEELCRVRHTSVPGGQSLRNTPVVPRVRSLAQRVEIGLISGELISSSYNPISLDTPTNLD